MENQDKTQQCAAAMPDTATGGKRKLFGRVWTREHTKYYVLGIPLIQKQKSPGFDVLKLIGIPVIKTYYDKFDKKTQFLGVPVSIRPNYRYLEQRISGSINCLNMLPGVPTKLRSNQSKLVTLAEARAILRKLPSYQLMCDMKERRLLLEEELTIVTHQMEKLLAPEGKIDG